MNVLPPSATTNGVLSEYQLHDPRVAKCSAKRMKKAAAAADSDNKGREKACDVTGFFFPL